MEFEIYFNDLVPEAQDRLLRAFCTTCSDENWEVFPLAIIESERT